MRPRDLVAFARMHLDGGAAADGTTVLSPSSVKAMQQRQVELPYLGIMGDAWGLGWELFDWPGGPVVGHDGSTIGQNAFLRYVPGGDVAVAMGTNGGDGLEVYQTVFAHVLSELAGVAVPAHPTPPADPPRIDAARYVGTYASRLVDNTVSQDGDGRIWVDQHPKGLAAEMGMTDKRYELVALSGDTLIAAEAEGGLHMPHAFVGDDGHGHTEFLHTGRADRRVAAP
jgi:hypothetical protein